MTLLFDPEVTAADLRGKRTTIIGLGKGRTTAGLARFLVSAGARVTIADPQTRDHLAEGIGRLGDLDVQLVLGPSSDDAALDDPDLVFVIPGIRPRSATILRAMQRGIPILTEMGLFFRLCPAPIIGVTGTKGKSTTMTLISRMLARGPRRVVSGGNIGTAVIQLLPSLVPDDLVVLELSSFQLETLARSPHVAVVTNALEDHLDHHGSRDAYHAAKSNIVRWQGAHDIAVLNLDDPNTLALHTGASSEVRGFSLSLKVKRGAYLDPGGMLTMVRPGGVAAILDKRELSVPGAHNVSNALAAAIVADEYGIPATDIADVLRSFEGLPHRLERVAERGGVLWINDSQGTTPYATIPALSAHGRTPVVILGGVAKGADFRELGREVAKQARAAILIGQAADDIAAAIEAGRTDPARPAVNRAATLAEAVRIADSAAQPGDVVLLSPACASFDMFSSYEARGDAFKRLVAELGR
ncbi:MAG: UDP-N-acetylmuramoyl-L-alanine--D-glutamate ligase [Chloroflexi bacterium]|nr:UDP-N-acetylmuramoyl-L-alanine--D-glutamate ligase [Chloroflexota bacterium]